MQLSAGGFRPLAGYRVVATLLLVAACAHGDSFTYSYVGNEGPFNPGPPVRLTYSVPEDQYPAWLPDGSGFLYSFVDATSRSGDRCLALLPPGGGQMRISRCGIADAGDDSTDSYSDPQALGNDQYVWVEQHSVRGRVLPDYGRIVRGTLDYRQSASKLLDLPYTASGGNVHATAANLRRLSPTQLAYIGVDLVTRDPCLNCKPDTLVVWHEVMLLNANGGTPDMLPNSDQTSSIWPDADGTGLYYTVTGDSRVYHRSLAGGAADVIHDFTTLGIARDVSVAGTRLTAVVGGDLSYGFDPLIGAPLQFDSGGRLFLVDLTSGNEQELWIANTGFRRPALSPDGQSVIAEGVDSTSSNRQPDLWLFRIP